MCEASTPGPIRATAASPPAIQKASENGRTGHHPLPRAWLGDERLALLALILLLASGRQQKQAGLPAGMAPERWNLENPQAVRQVYQSYVEAGADIILTNTFGGRSCSFTMPERY